MASFVSRRCRRIWRQYCGKSIVLVVIVVAAGSWLAISSLLKDATDASSRYLGCYEAETDRDAEIITMPNGTTTIGRCTSACKNRDFYYATLVAGGGCFCSESAPLGRARPSASCDAPCSGDAAQRCGGLGGAAVSVYIVREPNGWLEWTPWMRLEATEMFSRYRGCNRQLLTCKATVEKRMDALTETWEKDAAKHYIGCFTMSGTPEGAIIQSDWPEIIQDCMTSCSWRHSAYAAIKTKENVRRCLCLTTLGTSLPLNTCFNLYGLQVFSVAAFKDTVNLSFGTLPGRKKVLLIDHYWGGTFSAQLLLSSYPGAFHAHEPESLILSEGSYMYHQSYESTGGTLPLPLTEVLKAYFDCDMYRMPGRFLRKYPAHGGQNNVGFDEYATCSRLFFSHYGTVRCLPVLQESCQRSAVVTTKIVWQSNEADVLDFLKEKADVDVIQLVRDPKNTIALQNGRGTMPRNTTEPRARNLCDAIVSLSSALDGIVVSRRASTLVYENVLLSPAEEAANLYRYLGLPASKELLGALGKVYQSVASWSPPVDNATLALVNKYCGQVYKRFLFRPFTATATPSRLKSHQSSTSGLQVHPTLKYTRHSSTPGLTSKS